MVETKVDIFSRPIVIRFRGLYDYDGLLVLIRDYLKRFRVRMISEPKFKYKQKSHGAEVEFKINGSRKLTPYLRADMFVKGHAWEMIREEVVVNGKKTIQTKGKIELSLSCELIYDYDNLFKADKWSHKKMQEILDKPVQGLMWGENFVTGIVFLRGVLWDFEAQIKTFLKMECT